MSTFETRTLTCPHCGHQLAYEVATSLNIANKPALRDAILAGEFQKVVCDACGGAFLVEDPLMYIDFDRRLWIGMFPQDFEPAWAEHEAAAGEAFERYMTGAYSSPFAREMADGFRVRTVFGLPALAEKVLALDTGLDDRALAVLKLEMMRSVVGLPFSAAFRPRMLAMENERMVVRAPTHVEDGEVGWEILALPRTELDDIAADEVNRPVLAELGAGSYVDVGRLIFVEPTE